MNEDNVCGPLSHLIYIGLRQSCGIRISRVVHTRLPAPVTSYCWLKSKVSVLLAILSHNSFPKRMKSVALLTQKKTKYRGPPH
jgi:hypothetical protein